MKTSKKSSVTKKPKVVGIEVLKKNGVDVDALVKQLSQTHLLNLRHITTSQILECMPLEWRVKELRELLKMHVLKI